MILPLRYSAAVADNLSDLSALPDLPGTLGADVTNLSLTHAKYTARMLREGFLYVLIERLGIKSWTSYYVTEDSFLYGFPVEFPPSVKPEFSCDATTCGVDASMIAIPNAQDVKNIYLLFTPTPLTEAMLTTYKSKAETYVTLNKMQQFSPAAWLTGTTNQPHSMLPDVVKTTVAEYVLYNQNANAATSALGNTMSMQLFPAGSAAYSGVDTKGVGEAPGRLGALMGAMKRQKSAAFVIYDHIGITQELNNFRNAAFASIEQFLDERDEFQVTNQRKLTIHEKIQEVRVAIENGLVVDANHAAMRNDIQRRARVEPIFPDDSEQMKKCKMGANNAYTHPSREQWEAAHPELLDKFDEAYANDLQILPQRAQGNAKEIWKEKYLSRLNATAMSSFIGALDKVILAAQSQAEKRVEDHLKWVTSAQLLNAFDAYDKNHDVNGHAFERQSALCTFGMTGVPKSAQQVHEWVKKMKAERGNIYLRGIYMNQSDIENAANEAMPEIKKIVSQAPALDHVSGPSVLGVTKKLIDAFKKVDSAYDEWVRNPTQSGTVGWGKSPEAPVFAKLSELTKIAGRAGISAEERKMMNGMIGALAYSRLGDITKEIGFDEFMLKAEKAQPKKFEPGYNGKPKSALARLQRAARRATKNSQALVEQGMLDMIDDARKKVREKAVLNHTQVQAAHKEINAGKKVDLKTNNYHQARIGIALGMLESIAIWDKLSHFQHSGRAWTELTGSFLSLGGIACDIVYASVKSMREVKPYAKATGLDTAADIVRGRWKMTAGVLGTFAGLAQIGLDGLNLIDEANGKQRGFLMTIYGARAGVSLVSVRFGAVAAFSYAGPMLEYAAKRTGNVAKIEAAARLARKFGERRVLLLISVARFNAAGLALTGAEIAYYGYMKFIADNALQEWCRQSTFRSKKVTTNLFGIKKETDRYVTEEDEINALEAATREIMMED